jgi:hypothetical protein
MTADERSLTTLQHATPFDVEMLFERDLFGQSWSCIARFKDRVLMQYHHSDMLIWAEVAQDHVVDVTPVSPQDRHATFVRYHWRLLKQDRAALLASLQLDTPYDPDFGGLFEGNGRVNWQRFGPEALEDGDLRWTTLLRCHVPSRAAVIAIDVNDAGRITRYMLYEREPAYKAWRRLVEAQREPGGDASIARSAIGDV